MRYAIITALLCIFLSQNIQAAEHNDKTLQCIDIETFVDGRKYLRYEFGFSKSIQVYIAEGDTICDVVICGVGSGGSQCISTTCEKTPLLQWAFEELAIELKCSQYIIDDNYKPYHYRLSLHKDSCQIIATSSTLNYTENDELKDRINELKTFMVDLWYSNFIK